MIQSFCGGKNGKLNDTIEVSALWSIGPSLCRRPWIRVVYSAAPWCISEKLKFVNSTSSAIREIAHSLLGVKDYFYKKNPSQNFQISMYILVV